MSLNIILRFLFKLVHACSSLSLFSRSHFTFFPLFTFHFGVCTRAFQATRSSCTHLHIPPSGPRKQIWFITFLMLFVIARRSRHIKSKSRFGGWSALVCAGISISERRAKQVPFIQRRAARVSLEMTDRVM